MGQAPPRAHQVKRWRPAACNISLFLARDAQGSPAVTHLLDNMDRLSDWLSQQGQPRFRFAQIRPSS